MLKKLSYLLPLALVGACAYTIDGAIEEVKFVTPGAQNAHCWVYVDGMKYNVKPPQSVNLVKTGETLVVDCLAPGNRRKVVYIDPGVERSAGLNAANAGVGLGWDYLSNAMYDYPDVIEVNFTDTPVADSLPPAHNSPDIKQPEEYAMEEFSASTPKMNEDRNALPVEILRRSGTASNTSMDDDSAAFSEPEQMAPSGKSNLMDVIQDLSADMNPSLGAASEPTLLVPGE